MSCCAPGVEAGASLNKGKSPEEDNETLLAAARELGDGCYQLELAVPDIHCATCISTIEHDLAKLDMVDAARVNLSTKRVRIVFDPQQGNPSQITDTVTKSGHRVMLLDNVNENEDKHFGELVRALAVSGFAAGNIMLFSVSIWSGADEVTRDLFHWISALIAIPAVGFAGQTFFRSAFNIIRQGRLNMDVPIALAVVLSLGMSVFETARGAEQAYFDASVSLLFFLLIGRTLDHMMREKARGAVKNLARLAPKNAVQILPDGRREAISIANIQPGMDLPILAGQRIPVDCQVIEGTSEADVSLVTGEANPELVEAGTQLLAGTLILTGSIIVRAEQRADQSFLARMIEMMEAAEGSKAGYRRIADRAAAIYAPAVHILALLAFLGWGLVGGDWHQAILIGIAVLIITCPCALGLAVPMVHIVSAGRLFEAGIVMKDGAALERMADVTHVVFDKTGTLTQGRPRLVGQPVGDHKDLVRAASIARHSAHPFSIALSQATSEHDLFSGKITEFPGKGLEAVDESGIWRLGKAQWCNAKSAPHDATTPNAASKVWLSHGGEPVAAFEFLDTALADAKQTVGALKNMGCKITLLSGDQAGPVNSLAKELGIENVFSQLMPEQKVSQIQKLRNAGDKVLMVGDGINDAPALRAADASMAPASAADVGRSAADFIITRENLISVPSTLRLARRAANTVKQNFGLAIAYNLIAVPLAISGQVTPLFAALAMSSSSILVTLNALKLRFGNKGLGKTKKRPDSEIQHNNPQQLEPAE